MCISVKLRTKLGYLHHPDISHAILCTFSSLSSLLSTHALLITSNLLLDNQFTLSRLLASSSLSPFIKNNLFHADSIFSSIHFPTLFMHNTMIRAYSQSDTPINSLFYYKKLLSNRLLPDRFTFPFLLKSCSSFSDLGRSLHSHVLKFGLDSDVYIVNNAIGMYSKLSELGHAQKIFDEKIDLLDVVSWTSMITGYIGCGKVEAARWFFDNMAEKNEVSWNAMIGGYARAGLRDEAYKLFDRMSVKNVASWGSIISGFAQSGLCTEALKLFKEMIREGIRPNEATLVSVVSSSAQIRSLEHGEWISSYVEKNKIEMSVILSTAFVDIYGKCGNIRKAIDIFSRMQVKNVYSWNSMISGMANSGLGKEAITLFWKMKLVGIVPNDVTFIGLLSACSHARLVREGHYFFDILTRVYKIRPSEEHYGCMVDLLSRAGLIKEAIEFMDEMPVQPHPQMLGALAGACRVHGKLEIGEKVAKKLIELEPSRGSRYVLLANIYSAAKRWDDMNLVRKMLKERKVLKVAGNSGLAELKSVAR